jgi:hypothetical protein
MEWSEAKALAAALLLGAQEVRGWTRKERHAACPRFTQQKSTSSSVR